MPRHRMIVEIDLAEIRRAIPVHQHRTKPRIPLSFGDAQALALDGVKAIAPKGARDIRLFYTSRETGDLIWVLVLSWVGTEIVPAEDVARRIREFRARGRG